MGMLAALTGVVGGLVGATALLNDPRRESKTLLPDIETLRQTEGKTPR